MKEIAGDSGGDRPSRSEAFEDLMADHLDESFRVAVAILGDADEARDATQEAFITAWRAAAATQGPGQSRVLAASASPSTRPSRACGSGRATDRGGALRFAAGDGGGVDDGFVHRESLRTALWQLKPEHRVVLFLRFYEDLTVEQIAERIGIRRGPSSPRLHYGLERLRQAYEA